MERESRMITKILLSIVFVFVFIVTPCVVFVVMNEEREER